MTFDQSRSVLQKSVAVENEGAIAGAEPPRCVAEEPETVKTIVTVVESP